MDTQIEAIVLEFIKYAKFFKIEHESGKNKHKDEIEKKKSLFIFKFTNIIAIGNYIIKCNKLPQNCDILHIPSDIDIDIDYVYMVLYIIKDMYEKENNKIHVNVYEMIKYINGVEHIIKPAYDAFIKKKNECLK